MRSAPSRLHARQCSALSVSHLDIARRTCSRRRIARTPMTSSIMEVEQSKEPARWISSQRSAKKTVGINPGARNATPFGPPFFVSKATPTPIVKTASSLRARYYLRGSTKPAWRCGKRGVSLKYSQATVSRSRRSPERSEERTHHPSSSTSRVRLVELTSWCPSSQIAPPHA